jgi:hypothetical protein
MAMRVNEETYRRIVGRQFVVHWGTNYEPSIRATPKEAPGVSTASRLKSEGMGREVHLLSRNEVRVAIIALYNSAVWYIREQQMLFWNDREHFLHGHPLAGGEHWPAMRGTWNIAKEMGLEHLHPTVRVFDKKCDGRVRVPFPYVGDLLLFLRDDAGAYAVNLAVKDKMENFQRPFNLLGAKTPAEQKERVIARHKIERLAYEAAGIRTEQVAGSLIPKDLFNNLRFLHGQNWKARRYSAEQISVGLKLAEDGPRRERSPINIGVEIDRKLGLHTGSGCSIVWHGIWTRRIRADLYQALLPDRPLIPEQKDVLVDYAHWFRR